MMKNADKTIPYRLSEAELENLRILRKRTGSSGSIQDDKGEEKESEEIDLYHYDPGKLNQKGDKKIL
jgi:hypothetical protein